MKKISMIIFAVVLFATANSQTQSTSAKLTKQDSINAFVAKRDAYIDTLISKTSMKEFRKWLDESVSAKTFREGTLNDLWVIFLNIKVDEWIVRNKIPVPRN